MSLIQSSYHCLLPITLVDLHQACPSGAVASLSAHPEQVDIRVWALAHSALKAVRRREEREGRGLLAVGLRKSSLFLQQQSAGFTYLNNFAESCAIHNSDHSDVW